MADLFNKQLPQKCSTCQFAHVLQYSKEILCKKRGICDPDDCCRSYRYDPLKRIPKKAALRDDYRKEDFSLS